MNCGAELCDSEKKCPLCGTVVYHPDIKQKDVLPPYPKENNFGDRFSPSGALFIITMLFLIPMLVSIICNLELDGKLDWSLYAVGGIALAYIIIALPMWFKNPNPVIFVPCDFIAVGGYSLLICGLTGGKWFLSFAFPVIGGAMLIVSSVVALTRYLKRGYLYIFGGMFIALGAFMMLIEFFAEITFGVWTRFIWSYYPLVTCSVIGILLIIIAIFKPLKASLAKRFFI
ncbi:MAG: hypothetical protein KBS59_02140 [Clostridiales bacterium]|nr:hypothetical protein [Clostridiales bacterium]